MYSQNQLTNLTHIAVKSLFENGRASHRFIVHGNRRISAHHGFMYFKYISDFNSDAFTFYCYSTLTFIPIQIVSSYIPDV